MGAWSSCCTSAEQTLLDRHSNTDRVPKKVSNSSEYSDNSSSNSDNNDTQHNIYSNYEGNEAYIAEAEDTMTMTIPRHQSHNESDSPSREDILSGFHSAVAKGNESLVAYYLNEYTSYDLLSAELPNGDHPLHVAVRNKSHKLVLFLLDSGVSANILNEKTGDSPLHAAAIARDLSIITLLLDHSADVNVTNNAHDTPLTIAREQGDADVIELLSPETTELVARHITCLEEQLTNFQLPVDASLPMDDVLEEDEEAETDNSEGTASPPPPPRSRFAGPSTRSALPKALEPQSTESVIRAATDILGPTMAAKQHSKAPLRPTESTVFYEQNKRMRQKKLEAIKVARNNPFGRMKRPNTQHCLLAMQRLKSDAMLLPLLEAFLDKKGHKMPYSWHKRWVIVKRTHFLWSDKQRQIENPKNAAERKKFNGSFSLQMVDSVEAVKKGSKTQRKFKVSVRLGRDGKKKDILFRAACEEDRDYWVKSLKTHVSHIKSMVSFLGK